MLSRRIMSPKFRASNEQWPFALVAAAILLGILLAILLQVNWPTAPVADVPDNLIVELGKALVAPGQFLLVFEVASVLLLVALVGAVIIARER
jgi:NADH-quinone oxidoreductase subunit J